jgi:hypothetical protein
MVTSGLFIFLGGKLAFLHQKNKKSSERSEQGLSLQDPPFRDHAIIPPSPQTQALMVTSGLFIFLGGKLAFRFMPL